MTALTNQKHDEKDAIAKAVVELCRLTGAEYTIYIAEVLSYRLADRMGKKERTEWIEQLTDKLKEINDEEKRKAK